MISEYRIDMGMVGERMREELSKSEALIMLGYPELAKEHLKNSLERVMDDVGVLKYKKKEIMGAFKD